MSENKSAVTRRIAPVLCGGAQAVNPRGLFFASQMRKKLRPSLLISNGSSVRNLSVLYCLCLALVLPISTATANDLPRFEAAQSCRRGEIIQLGVNPFAACMKQEDDALDELKAHWSQFSQADKTACIRLSNSGGVAGSYIELLTCLEMKKDPETFLSTPRQKTENLGLPSALSSPTSTKTRLPY